MLEVIKQVFHPSLFADLTEKLPDEHLDKQEKQERHEIRAHVLELLPAKSFNVSFYPLLCTS